MVSPAARSYHGYRARAPRCRVYTLVYPYLGLSPQTYGVFAGSTIHEVAQVVAAGRAVSDTAGRTAGMVSCAAMAVSTGEQEEKRSQHRDRCSRCPSCRVDRWR